MASTVVQARVPKLPSIVEMTKQLHESLPGLVVFNPHHEWVNLEFHGRLDVWAPPDKGGAVEPHPVTGVPTVCNGEVEIKGKFFTVSDSSGKVKQGFDAQAAVTYLCAPENYGQMGLVWLPKKDAATDDEYRKLGREVHAAHQRGLDESLVQKRREFKQNWEKSHRGVPCPPPTRGENEAIDRLQDFEHAKAYLYECAEENCIGYAANDWRKFEGHMLKAHKIKPNRSDYEGGMVAPAKATELPEDETPVRRGPGRPRKMASPPPVE